MNQFSQQNNGSGLNTAFAKRFSRPVPGNDVSEVLTRLRSVMVEDMKNEFYEGEVATVVPVDGSTTSYRLHFSGIAVCYQVANDPTRVAYYTLVLASTGEPLEPISEPLYATSTMFSQPLNSQQRIETTVVPGDGYDDGYAAMVLEQVQKAFPAAKKLIYADVEVVPADFDLSDAKKVKNLLRNALSAAAVRYQVQEGITDIDLSTIANDPTNYAMRIVRGARDLTDSLDQPVRADIEAIFGTNPQRNNQQRQSINGEANRTFTRADALIDLLPTNRSQFNQYAMPTLLPGQVYTQCKFTPHVVVTRLKTELAAPTLASALLSFFPILQLAETGEVQQHLVFEKPAKGRNFHELGALNVMANIMREQNTGGIGKILETSAASFDEQNQLRHYLGAVLTDDILFSMDVEETGESTWLLGVFGKASLAGNADLDAEAQRATVEIVESAATLTGEAFRKYFPENARVVLKDSERIPLGYFFDADGVKRDLREIDLLHILNLTGENGDQDANEWLNTFNPSQDPRVNMSMRIQKIKLMYPSAVITGFAQRVTFSSEFINALISGMSDMKLNLTAVRSYGGNYSATVPLAQQMQQASVKVGTHGVFNGVARNQNNNGRVGVGRWA